uniref:Uncharacterized protein n=2 Tax=Clytia hemisphaerica TaxID=252671 RepID=A0A7M5WRW6_9CNID
MNDKKDLARDFDICCTVMSDANHCGFLEMLETLKARSKGEKPLKGKEEPLDPDYLDEYMRSKHKEEYADGVDGLDTSGNPGLMLPVILVYLQWANVDKNAKFGDNDEADWFTKVRAALLTPVSDGDKKKEYFFTEFKQTKVNVDWQFVDEKEHTAMSKLTRYWCYKNIREFVQPYEKRVYVTERKNLSKKDDVLKKTWPEWATERIDEIMVDGNEEMNLVVQIQPFGGDNSMFNKNGDPSDQTTHGDHGCHSWRQDISLVQVLDYFYRSADKEAIHDPAKDKHLITGLEWQAENDKTAGTTDGNKGFFSEFDRRLLWGSYARLTDPDEGTSLDSLHKCYFDTDQKYNDLVEIKKDVDKDHIFTPNSFAVGAKDAPDKRNLPIRGRGHKAYLEKASGKKQ